jgi:hypothetical protein
MNFEFSGKLCGYLCSECVEDLSGVKVRLYRNRQGQNVTGLAVANPKDTLAILDDDEVKAKTGSLIAETETKADGSFTFQLGAEQKYEGGAFEVDVYCTTVPHLKRSSKAPKPLQFSITTLQPLWKQTDRGAAAYWQYCVPERFWCGIRHKFGAWTICGRVLDCHQEVQTAVAGVKVSAFDVDCIQDDYLGFAITDATGHFRIDYLAIDFKRTPFPFINIELFGGPDVYFKIEAPGGGVLLDEPRSRGRDKDREDIGPCFCVELCVDQPVSHKHAWFTHVGDFDINSDFDLVTGKTSHAAPVGMADAHGGPGFGFYDGINGYGLKLVGDCPATHPNGGDPMRYRFLYEHPSNPGVLVPLTGTSRISAQVVGTRPVNWDFGFGPIETFQSIVVAGTGGTTSPPPPPVPAVIPPPGTSWGPVPPAVIIPDANGWVTVDPTVTNGALSGPLIRFISASAVPGGSATSAGDLAGNPPGSLKNGTVIRIVFEAEPVTGPSIGSPTLTNDLKKILINNWLDVNLLDLVQFAGGCCTPLTNALGIKYTTEHELMRSWSLGISSCASSLGWVAPVLPSGPTGAKPRGDNGTDNINTTTWPGCSYLVSLSTTRSLTDGEQDDLGRTNQLTFCICR